MKRIDEKYLTQKIGRIVKSVLSEQKVKDLGKSKFDYVEEGGDLQEKKICEFMTKKYGRMDERTMKACKSGRKSSELDEKLVGGQKKLDKNKNGKVDAQDFKMLRKSKYQTDEGDCMECGNKGMYEGAKNTVKLTESEIISLIEAIVTEEKKKSIKVSTPKGLRVYDKAHKASGKENDDYLKSVTKKMTDYLKDGSKGKYETSPEYFPKGNGQLAKMDKKAYVPSEDVADYVDNFTAAALENIVYDEIHPNEDWVSDNIVGSSRTGNGKGANAIETGVNKKRNEIRKKNMLGKLKQKAYNKAPQPAVIDKSGSDEGDKILAKLESTSEKQKAKLNEEFSRMMEMMNYDKTTQ
jgi:hypothetical protein